MSNRSTPGPAAYPSIPVYHTTQISGNVPDPFSSSRSTRAPLYATNNTHRPSVTPSHRPSIPGFHRRDSDRSVQTRQSVAPSVVGTSTPTQSHRRLRRVVDGKRGDSVNGINGSGPSAKEDWAAIEPDEVFKRLPVNEVKRVEAKMRSEALNKQTELRSMVG